MARDFLNGRKGCAKSYFFTEKIKTRWRQFRAPLFVALPSAGAMA
jgi:hypothetical protein